MGRRAGTGLKQIMTPDEAQAAGVDQLTNSQKDALYQWGLRMFSMGQHVVAEIDEVMFEGHLILLTDGSRWEVDSMDTFTAEMWGMFDKVVIIYDTMYNIENADSVTVQESSL